MKFTTNLHLAPRLRTGDAIPLHLEYVLMAWSGTSLPLLCYRFTTLHLRQVTLSLSINHSNNMYKEIWHASVSHYTVTTVRLFVKGDAKCSEESFRGLNEVLPRTWLEELRKTRENFRQDSQFLQDPFKYYHPRQARSTK